MLILVMMRVREQAIGVGEVHWAGICKGFSIVVLFVFNYACVSLLIWLACWAT